MPMPAAATTCAVAPVPVSSRVSMPMVVRVAMTATPTTAAAAMPMFLPMRTTATTTCGNHRCFKLAILKLHNCLRCCQRVGTINFDPLLDQGTQGDAIDAAA